jgi:hypothetical protein
VNAATVTSGPVQVADPAQLEPEWADATGLRRMFGLSRTTAYRLESEGRIRSVLLRRRGFKSGRRLYAVDSVRAMFREALAEAGGAA